MNILYVYFDLPSLRVTEQKRNKKKPKTKHIFIYIYIFPPFIFTCFSLLRILLCVLNPTCDIPFILIDLILIFGVLTPLSTIFQLYHSDQLVNFITCGCDHSYWSISNNKMEL